MAAEPSDQQERTGLALYRKYRPATFAEVKGQEHVTGPLRQALSSGRINHAYLFSGPRGCGKTSSARILARSLNCVNGPTPDPCGACESCVALAPTGPGSIDVIEIDAASHGGVDDARELRERAFYAPVSGRFKIYIIDEAHMVTQQGFNALLKLVEEPPSHLKFIFATTEPEKVIPTIRSRTHHYPFRLVPPSVLRELLEEILNSEGVPFEDSVLPLVVRAGAGSARDSLSILDQLLAGSDENGLRYDHAVALLGYTDASLLDEVVDAFAARDGAAVFHAVNRVIEGGHEPRRFAMDLLDRLRDLIMLASVPDAASNGLLDVPPDRAETLATEAANFGMAGLTRAAEIVSTGLDQMRGATSPRLLLELMCAQVLLPAVDTDAPALLARLERLEAGAPPRQAAPAPAAAPSSPSPASAESSASAEPGAGAAPGRRAATAGRQDTDPGQAAPPRPERDESGRPAGSQQASGQLTADTLRGDWPGLLETIRARRKVAWMMLNNASVLSFDEGTLTLGFPRPGDVKGFASSGYEELLKEVLASRFGTSFVVKAVAGEASRGVTQPSRPRPSASTEADPQDGSTASSAAPRSAGSDLHGAVSEPVSGTTTRGASAGADSGGAGRADGAAVAGGRGQAADVPAANRSAAAAPASNGPALNSPASSGPARNGSARAAAAPAVPVPDAPMPAAEMDEPDADDYTPAGDADRMVTSIDIIQRELGGEIIG